MLGVFEVRFTGSPDDLPAFRAALIDHFDILSERTYRDEDGRVRVYFKCRIRRG